MSTEKGEGISTHASHAESSQTSEPTSTQSPTTPPKLGEEPEKSEGGDDRKPSAKPSTTATEQVSPQTAEGATSPSTPEDISSRPRQVIAVSASKGPTAFFNLARKFLVTDEMCDLSALEGAIVSAVDAAHLLERSKLATIVRVQTSYVIVEPKRRKQPPGSPRHQHHPPLQPADASPPPAQHSRGRASSGRELRRARIVITVKRTESYKHWLEENPIQAIIAGDSGDTAAAATGDQGESGAQPS